jgi:hypothetical protein
LEDFTEVVVNWSGQLYRCENLRLGYQLVDLDRYTPLDMRAPGAATACSRWKSPWTNWPTRWGWTRWRCG